MKIVLFDDILERHVRRSLARALRDRGHEVYETQPIWRGHRFPTAKEDLAPINLALDQVLALAPDLILNFRAATMTPQMLERIKFSGARSAVWLPDDPVLYQVCYHAIVEHYDIVLNCGPAKVLDFYQERHSCKGVNFPFWTDNTEFPRCYSGADGSEYDVVFLGNLKGGVRRNRYGLVAGVPGSVRIYGRVENDPQGLCHGYLDDQSETASKLGAARLALNIPQFFKDYAGLPYDFPDLAGLGQFEFPSRVIQYAAIGLPIVSYGRVEPPETFPEMLVAKDQEGLREVCSAALADPERLEALATATHRRFKAAFTAERRAQLLEYLIEDGQSVSRMLGADRARLFAQFGGASRNPVARLLSAVFRG